MELFQVKSEYANIDKIIKAKSELGALRKLFYKKCWDINSCPTNDLFEVEKIKEGVIIN